ncbi:hypothetical protein CDAR_18591 [Caerostris darwini]|uniref:Uncharacterized protein n=1 Tax=Caerostris darwini TaxID=1538125 RepID=A0AAV4V968_9ARAC|nr:hypothetical protein CDAR_18591 [Caerostris darwini]
MKPTGSQAERTGPFCTLGGEPTFLAPKATGPTTFTWVSPGDAGKGGRGRRVAGKAAFEDYENYERELGRVVEKAIQQLRSQAVNQVFPPAKMAFLFFLFLSCSVGVNEHYSSYIPPVPN